MPVAATKVDGNNHASSSVEDRLARARLRLNPRRQRLLRAILDSADETCFLSSRELAKRYNVDATTILRTTQVLGYKSFADFSTDLRQHFVARITPYAALKAATREKRSVVDHIDHALDKALENLKVLESDLDRQRLIELAKLIKRSRRVLVVGLDFAASLAYYLAYGLCALGVDAEAPVGSTGNLQYKVKALTPRHSGFGFAGEATRRADLRYLRRRHDTHCSLRRQSRGDACRQSFISQFLCCTDGGHHGNTRGVRAHRSQKLTDSPATNRQRVRFWNSLVPRA